MTVRSLVSASLQVAHASHAGMRLPVVFSGSCAELPCDARLLPAVQPIHGPNSAFVTKELDLEEMEHANFDPEVAAAFHEDGLEEADLGYWDGGDYGLGHHQTPEGMRDRNSSFAVHCGTSSKSSAPPTSCLHANFILAAEKKCMQLRRKKSMRSSW